MCLRLQTAVNMPATRSTSTAHARMPMKLDLLNLIPVDTSETRGIVFQDIPALHTSTCETLNCAR